MTANEGAGALLTLQLRGERLLQLLLGRRQGLLKLLQLLLGRGGGLLEL